MFSEQESENSRRRFLINSGGAALLALSTGYGAGTASASPTTSPHNVDGAFRAATVSEQSPTMAGVAPEDLVIDWYTQWTFDFDRPRHTLLSKRSFSDSGRNYNLRSDSARRYLQWERQWFGVNIGWTDDVKPATARKVARWFLRRPGTDSTPLKYGEKLALGNGGNPSFLRYAKRTVGVNLEWANSPSYEWRIVRSPEAKGSPILSGQSHALYNARAGNDGFLINFDRTVGGDIGWPDSQTWLEQVPGHLKALFKALGKEAWEEAKKAAKAYLLS